MASPFYVTMVEAMTEHARTLGVDFVFVDANEDVLKQNSDIADVLMRGVDVLILNAVDPDGVAPSIAAARGRNVPIVTVDRFVNAEVTSIVGRDNALMGQAVGEAVVAAIGGRGNARGVILEVMGAAGCRVQEARSRGFRSVVDRESGISVIQTPFSNYVRSLAATATMDIIQARRDITVIYGHNDDMTLGALQVMEDAGMRVLASGVDGLIEAVGAIRDRRYLATAANDPSSMGRVALETAVRIARGETVPREIDPGSFLIDASNAHLYYNPALMFAQGR
jgi:ribose transport system substrate-binding protein